MEVISARTIERSFSRSSAGVHRPATGDPYSPAVRPASTIRPDVEPPLDGLSTEVSRRASVAESDPGDVARGVVPSIRPPIVATLDSDELSRIVAAAVATAVAHVLQERPTSAAAMVQPREPKQSFWASVLQVDVLLALLAMVIVLVVLFAWSA